MLQKGFFLTESHNPNLPPETWELVAEFTTPGTYTQSLDWGKYRFEASAGGGGSGAAVGGYSERLNSWFNSAGASGGTGAYGSFVVGVSAGNIDRFSLVVGGGGNGGIRQNGTAPTTSGGATTISSIILGTVAILNGGGAAYAHATSNGDTAVIGAGGVFTTTLATHNLNNGKNGISASTSDGNKSADTTNNPSPYNAAGFGGGWSFNSKSSSGNLSGGNGGAGFIRIYKSNLKPEPL